MASLLRNLTIKWKMVLLTSSLMALVSLAALLLLPSYLELALQAGWKDKISAVSSMLAASLEPAVQLQQVSDEDEMFVGARRDEALIGIRVEEPDGKRLAGFKDEGIQVQTQELKAGELWLSSFEGDLLHCALLIEAAGTPVGVLRMTYSLAAYKEKQTEVWNLGLLIAALIFVLGSIITYLVGHRLTKPMRKMTDNFKSMAAGELTQKAMGISSNDEVGQLAQAYDRLLGQFKELSDHARLISDGDLTKQLEGRGDLADAFRAMAGAITDMIKQFNELSSTIEGRTTDILATAKQQEAGAAQQAATVSEVTATMGELAATARQIAANAESVTSSSEQAAETVSQGRSSLSALTESISNIQTGNRTINDNIVQLNRHVQQIGGIIEIINDIADRSDLLALNAALEGTKAGEAGKGFLLVAAEMRRLAENVFNSTAEIKQLIGEVTEASNSTVMATESGMKATAEGVNRANETERVFDAIVAGIEETTRAAKQISVATQQQHTGTDQIVSAMGEVSEVSQQTLDGISHTTRSVSELGNIASQLRQMFEKYRIA